MAREGMGLSRLTAFKRDCKPERIPQTGTEQATNGDLFSNPCSELVFSVFLGFQHRRNFVHLHVSWTLLNHKTGPLPGPVQRDAWFCGKKGES